MVPHDRPQFAATRKRAAQRLKRDMSARQPLHEPRTEALRRIAACSPDRKRKEAGAESSASRPHFAVQFLWLIQVQCQASSQP